MVTGISGKQYIDNIKNPEYQISMYYTEDELKEYIKTPLMKKKEFSSHIDKFLSSYNTKENDIVNNRKTDIEL